MRSRMVIRSAPQVCLVIMSGGLTLELSYDHLEPTTSRDASANGGDAANARAPSQSVWLLNHEVLLKAAVGQA
jgi:hypothetical protein